MSRDYLYYNTNLKKMIINSFSGDRYNVSAILNKRSKNFNKEEVADLKVYLTGVGFEEYYDQDVDNENHFEYAGDDLGIDPEKLEKQINKIAPGLKTQVSQDLDAEDSGASVEDISIFIIT